VACPVAGCAGRVARGAMATHLQVESVQHFTLLSSRLVAAEERATRRSSALQRCSSRWTATQLCSSIRPVS
jgi:ribosomal protein L15E